ncbi:MAG: hypothetical protein ABSF37_05925 [Sedimentisphaerales bacterium]|jgi:hypothetical protein
MAKQKEEILFEWVCPKEVSLLAAKAQFKRAKIVIPWFVLITGIILAVLCFAFDYLLPQDSGFSFGKLFVVGIIAITLASLLGYIVIIISAILSRRKYQITADKVFFVFSGDKRFIRWKDTIGYKMGNYGEFEGFPGVIIYHKGQFGNSICLPQDERAEQITNYIAGRIPLLDAIPSHLETIKLTVRQKIWLCVFTGLYSLCISVFSVFYSHRLILLIWAVPFLGPGTIYLVSVYKSRFLSNKNLQLCASAFNVISFVFIAVLILWLFVWQMKREYGW